MSSTKIVIETNKAVAFDSPDHLEPWGTARDDSQNALFNAKCHRAVENQPQRGGSNPASLRCWFDRVFEVEGQESVGGWIAG